MDSSVPTRRLWRALRLTVAQLCLIAAATTLAAGGWRLPGLDPTARVAFYSLLAVGVAVAVRPAAEILARHRE